MHRLLIIIPAIESETEILTRNLDLLLEKLQKLAFSEYRIVIIYQTDNFASDPVGNLRNGHIEVYNTDVFSLSSARNMGLDMRRDEEFVFFLDSRMIPGMRFLKACIESIQNSHDIWLGKICWLPDIEDSYKKNESTDSIVCRTISPLRLIYKNSISIYVYRFELIKGLRFNETIGISRHNSLQAGEDTLFNYDLLLSGRVKSLQYYPDAFLYHEIRPKDYSKQVRYSMAQGALHRYLISRKMPLIPKILTIINFILFIGNTFYRILTVRKNSIQMLRLRLIGFFTKRIEHNI